VIISEKIDILAYIYNHPYTSSSQINNYFVLWHKSRKTTSTILKYLKELVSDGYIKEIESVPRKFLITSKGRSLLNSLPESPHQKIRKHSTTKVIILTLWQPCLFSHPDYRPYPMLRYPGETFK